MVADVHTMGHPINKCNMPNTIISRHFQLAFSFTFALFVIIYGLHSVLITIPVSKIKQ